MELVHAKERRAAFPPKIGSNSLESDRCALLLVVNDSYYHYAIRLLIRKSVISLGFWLLGLFDVETVPIPVELKRKRTLCSRKKTLAVLSFVLGVYPVFFI